MADSPFETPPTMTANATLMLFGRTVDIAVTAPVGRVQFDVLILLIQQLADVVVDVAVAECGEQGVGISCKKGCGACCIQAVPVAPAEARAIRDLVAELPEPRRAVVRERFLAGREKLAEAGLLDRFLDTSGLKDGEILELGREYLSLQIPCPFLEEQACSIHPQRPVRCREYLVTSSAKLCRGPEVQQITRVRLPAEVFRSMLAVGWETAHGMATWVPMIIAPEWADAHPDTSMPRPGTDLVRELFEALTGKTLTSPDVPL